jgi:hypothetical protein
MKHMPIKQALAVVLVVGAAILPSTAHAAPARTSVDDIGRMIAKSLTNVSSFQVVFDSGSGTGAAAAASKERITEYFVRHGAGFSMYAVFKGHGQTMTMVDTGKHLCQRRGDSGAWNCNFPTSLALSYFSNLDIVKAYKSSGTVLRDITASGTKTIQGQSCQGYNFTATTSLIHFTAHGTYWFSSASGRIVELTEVGSIVVSNASAPIVSTSTVVYSRWNDPSIKIPTVPAS